MVPLGAVVLMILGTLVIGVSVGRAIARYGYTPPPPLIYTQSEPMFNATAPMLNGCPRRDE